MNPEIKKTTTAQIFARLPEMFGAFEEANHEVRSAEEFLTAAQDRLEKATATREVRREELLKVLRTEAKRIEQDNEEQLSQFGPAVRATIAPQFRYPEEDR